MRGRRASISISCHIDGLLAHGLFMFFSFPTKNGQTKFEDAYNLYNEAANIYKINKKFDRSADAYAKAAGLIPVLCFLSGSPPGPFFSGVHVDMQLKLEAPHEAARCYVDASNMLKKTNPKGQNKEEKRRRK
jgi:hypothetical protein